MSALTSALQYHTGRHSNATRKRNKKYTDREGRNKTVYVSRWYDKLCINSKRLAKKPPAIVNDYSTVVVYKVNIKSLHFPTYRQLTNRI